jgi:hypothetical protein
VRSIPRLGLASLAWLGVAPVATAGTLVAASLHIGVSSMPAATFSASAGASGTSAGPTAASLAAGTALAGTATLTFDDSYAPPITQVVYGVGANAAGAFGGATPDVVGGSMALPVSVTLSAFGGLTLLAFDMPVGTAQTLIPPPFQGLIGITAQGSAWTAGTASIGLLTPTTAGAAVTTRMGSNSLNAKGAGALVLVSAVDVLWYSNRLNQYPSFATLTLQYVPEPGALAWIATPAAALLVAARRRAQRATKTS